MGGGDLPRFLVGLLKLPPRLGLFDLDLFILDRGLGVLLLLRPRLSADLDLDLENYKNYNELDFKSTNYVINICCRVHEPVSGLPSS